MQSNAYKYANFQDNRNESRLSTGVKQKQSKWCPWVEWYKSIYCQDDYS